MKTPTTFLKETMTHPTKEGVEIAKRIIEEKNKLIEEAKDGWEDIWRKRIGSYIDRLGAGGYGIAEEVDFCIEELRALRLSSYEEGRKDSGGINSTEYNRGVLDGRKKEREEIKKWAEGLKCEARNVDDMAGMGMNEESVKELVIRACNGRQNTVLNEIITHLKNNN